MHFFLYCDFFFLERNKVSFVLCLRDKPDALRRNTGLLQIASACVEALKHPDQGEWDRALSAEKLFIQAMGEENGTPTLDQILTILEKGQTEQL